jgi:hypothetical protein
MAKQFDYSDGTLFGDGYGVIVDDEGVVLRKGEGAPVKMAFSDMGHIRYWALSASRMSFEGFDFTSASGETIELRLRYPENAGEGHPDRVAHARIMREVLEKLAVHRPDLTVEIGTKPWVRWSLFLIGVIALMFTVMAIWLVFETGRNDRFLTAALPFGLLFIFGGALTWANRPGQDKVFLRPVDLIEKAPGSVSPDRIG